MHGVKWILPRSNSARADVLCGCAVDEGFMFAKLGFDPCVLVLNAAQPCLTCFQSNMVSGWGMAFLVDVRVSNGSSANWFNPQPCC